MRLEIIDAGETETVNDGVTLPVNLCEENGRTDLALDHWWYQDQAGKRMELVADTSTVNGSITDVYNFSGLLQGLETATDLILIFLS